MIVPATLADAAELAVLEAATMGGEAWSPAQVAAELDAAERGARVVRVLRDVDGGELAGWCDLAVAGDSADLLRIAVHPDARRAGHGAALLNVATDALPREVDRVLLEVAAGNAAARALYDRHGFVEIARRARYYRDGSDAVVMQRALDPREETP